MRILITGSRSWTDESVIQQALDKYAADGDTLVSGACRTGADAIAEKYWTGRGPIERYPADWRKHGKFAGPKRNQEMVDAGADICLAFPEQGSKGTKHCMKAAEAAGIKVINFGEL